MPQTVTGARAQSARQRADHVLFVEGAGKAPFDREVLRVLLDENGLEHVGVEALGAFRHVTRVAEALHEYHPNYYFLADRDDRTDEQVEKTWRAFPDPTQHNLLIWRRREFESYFIDPDYLRRTKWLKQGAQVEHHLLEETARRVFWDAADLTIIAARETLRENWITLFPAPQGLETRDDALRQLLGRGEFRSFRGRAGRLTSARWLDDRYTVTVDRFLDGAAAPGMDRGTWLHEMSAKEILPTLVGSCCTVKNAVDRRVQGAKAVYEVARSLVALPLDQQPEDFRDLLALLAAATR